MPTGGAAMKRWIWLPCVLIFAGCNFDERVPTEMVSMKQARPLGKEKSLESSIWLDVGSLEIKGAGKSEPLYSMNLEYDKASYTPDVNYSSASMDEKGRLLLKLESIHKMGIRRQGHSNTLRLAFNDSVPLDLDLNTGVVDARLSLSGMKIARLRFESGVGGGRMSAYEPNSIPCESITIKNGVGKIEAVGLGNLNFRDLEFEGGVGGANLDFTGEWKQNADVRIQLGMGGVNVVMPRDVGVRLESEKHFLNGLQLEGFQKRDDYYYSDNYEKATIKVSLRVVAGIGGFKVTWI
jgi:uncharacterized protein DUF2154